MSAPGNTPALELAGQRAITEATRLWNLDVYDPPRSDKTEHARRSREVINGLLLAAGWKWEVPYAGDGAVEWCGIFAAACWKAAGLDPRWLATYFASTYRLDLWGGYRSFDTSHPNPRPSSEPRLMAAFDQHSTTLPWEPKAGDILMIGDGSPPMGDHITLVESYDAARKTFRTLEGNGVGRGPDGQRRQGIVRAERNLGGGGYCARRLIRPSFRDLLAEVP